MRKLFWGIAIIAVGAVATSCWSAGYARRHPESFPGRIARVVFHAGTEYNPVYRANRGLTADVIRPPDCSEDDGSDPDPSLTTPEEPRPVEQLPDQPVPVEAPQLPEPINLIVAAAADSSNDKMKDKRLSDFVPEVPEVIIPDTLVLPGADGEVDNFALMPTCPDDEDEKQGPMPYAVEDQEAKPVLLTPKPRATMEFRPSDARRGEFERIPF
jgi:hypothetical protein